MNGQAISKEHIEQLLQLADWAPNHGNTEPWRFVVYGGDKVKMFCQQHADLYKNNTPVENFMQGTYDKLLHNGDKASHIIVVIMQRGDLPKIPALEEVAAVSAAVQNVLLGATALNIATIWSTGGMTLKPAMKHHFGLREEDHVLGLLYMGYTDVHPEGRRKIPLENKITWVE